MRTPAGGFLIASVQLLRVTVVEQRTARIDASTATILTGQTRRGLLAVRRYAIPSRLGRVVQA
jgi:hypothetical protein